MKNNLKILSAPWAESQTRGEAGMSDLAKTGSTAWLAVAQRPLGRPSLCG
jgi:hypothetical protein